MSSGGLEAVGVCCDIYTKGGAKGKKKAELPGCSWDVFMKGIRASCAGHGVVCTQR